MKTRGFRQPDWMGLLFVLAASLVICSIVYGNFVLQRGQMMWDEAEHAFTSLIFLNDMLKLDVPSLAGHMHGQILWPPVHTFLTSLLFLASGPTITNARTFSLFMYFAFAISMYFLGRELVEKDKAVSGVLCSVFSLVTGSLYLSASEAMLEITALLFFSLSVLSFLRFLKDRRWWWAVPAFTLLTFFSKTNFGIVLILGISFHFILKRKFRLKKILMDRDFTKILWPVLIVIILWLFVPPDRFLTFLGFLVNRPEGPPPFSIAGLSYYPLQLYEYSGMLVLVFLAGFILSLRYWKNERVRFLIIMILLTVLLNVFHQNKKMRYILYLYPPLFGLAAFHLSRFYSKLKFPRKGILLCIILVVSMSAYSAYLYQGTGVYAYPFSMEAPIGFITESISQSKAFVIGEFNEISPGLLDWRMSNSTYIKEVKASSYSVWEFENFSNLISGKLGVPLVRSPQGINNYIEQNRFDKMVLIELQNTSSFYNTEDYLVYNSWKLDYARFAMENTNYTMEDKRAFGELGMEITILKRVQAP